MSSPSALQPNATIFPDSFDIGNVIRRRNLSNIRPLWSRDANPDSASSFSGYFDFRSRSSKSPPLGA
jgi:hypothetical protein